MRLSALLLIEFQYDWLNEKGKLYQLMSDKTQFSASLRNAKNVIQAARHAAMPIVHSGLMFSDDYKELGQAKYGLRAAIPAHQTFLASKEGSKFVEPFVPQAGEFIISGRIGGSAFAGSNLGSHLRNNNINTLYIMGYALHVCVESTLRAAHDLGYEIILLEDASSAFTKEQREHVLNEVVHHFGMSMKSQALIELLKHEEK